MTWSLSSSDGATAPRVSVLPRPPEHREKHLRRIPLRGWAAATFLPLDEAGIELNACLPNTTWFFPTPPPLTLPTTLLSKQRHLFFLRWIFWWTSPKLRAYLTDSILKTRLNRWKNCIVQSFDSPRVQSLDYFIAQCFHRSTILPFDHFVLWSIGCSIVYCLQIGAHWLGLFPRARFKITFFAETGCFFWKRLELLRNKSH